MTSDATAATLPQNRLLQLLPPSVLAQLQPRLEPLHLHGKEVLSRAHEPLSGAYFPDTAVVSLVANLESGQSLEVGLVGRDGVVGMPAFPGTSTMPCDAIVQIPGLVQRIAVGVLKDELLRDEKLYSVLCRFQQVLLSRSMQMSLCNMFHPVEQRCIRWLLTVNDLIDRDAILLTHESIATMLGVHRPTVTLVLRSLAKAGLVEEARGRILLRDRAGLETACCDCYRVIRDEWRRLLGF